MKPRSLDAVSPSRSGEKCPECEEGVLVVDSAHKAIVRTFAGEDKTFKVPAYVCDECGFTAMTPLAMKHMAQYGLGKAGKATLNKGVVEIQVLH